MIDQILQGDNIEILKTLPDGIVDCCVTSPPYYGLRDYGTGKWIGGDPNCPHRRLSKFSEKTITGHHQEELAGNVGDAIYKSVCPLCGAVREDKQIGLEDTPEEYIQRLVDVFHEVKRVLKDDGTLWVNIGDTYNNAWDGAKNKDLIGIPWMLAFALRNDGWYLRQDIIWHKPNPMPEPVKDRCVKSHEYIFLLSKKPHYYFDYEAIQEDSVTGNERHFGGADSINNGKYESIEQESSVRQGMNKNRGNGIVFLRKELPSHEAFVDFMRKNTTINQLVEATDISKTTIEHWFRRDESGFAYPSPDDWCKIRDYVNDWSKEYEEIDYGLTNITMETDEIGKNSDGKRNKRDVWSVSTRAVKEAHFSTFPENLITPCILAGCRNGGVVLDPFFGSGTTGRVAVANGRHYIGIELNPEYIDISKRRTNNVQMTLFSMM